MDTEAEVRRFLSACRARLSPEQAGVPAFEGVRRVPGLRREEVAHLAGVSVDYYTKLERGRLGGVSDGVLESVARALQLGDVEREHLFHLARSLRGRSIAAPRRARPRVRPEIERVLEAITVPAFVQNSRLDVLAANDIGWAVYSPSGARTRHPFNHLEFQFLDPRARTFHIEWEHASQHTVAVLRAAAARDPEDETISDLIRDMSAGSEQFRRMWSSAHDVRRFRSGSRRFRHPVVGELAFGFESFDLAGDDGLVLVIYSPDPAANTVDALRGLPAKSMRWAAGHRLD